MRSKKYRLALGILAVPALTASVSALFGHPWLPEAATAALLLMIAVICLDTNRRARSRYQPRPTRSTNQPQTVAAEDLMGTIRLLQAQYVGRLDRSQAALEDATAALLAACQETSPNSSPTASPHAQPVDDHRAERSDVHTSAPTPVHLESRS